MRTLLGRTRVVLASAAVLALTLVAERARGGADGDRQEPRADAIATAPGWVDVEGGLRRLAPAVGGIVVEVAVKEGDVVEAGALLARLDDGEAKLEAESAAIEVARAERERAGAARELGRKRDEARRLAPLVAAQTEPADELRRVHGDVADLESRLALADLAIRSARLKAALADERARRLSVRAPARGEVLRVLARVGDTAAAGSPLVWFAGDGRRIVRAELDERLFGRVRAGMRAEVRAEYDDAVVYPARVLRVARAVGPVEALPEVRPSAKDDRVVECVLELDGDRLLIGQRVLVRVTGGE